MFNPRQFFRNILLSFLGISFFVFGTVALVWHASRVHADYTARISVSIRQKAISADLVRQTYQIRDDARSGKDVKAASSELASLLVKWEKAQRGLTSGSVLYGIDTENSQDVQNLLFTASGAFSEIRDHMREWQAAPAKWGTADVASINVFFQTYQEGMDAVTGRLIHESEQAFRNLLLLAGGLMFFLFVAVFAVYRWVLRPGSIRLSDTAEELNRLEDDVQRASQVKTEFMANISHEIRTPLNGVIGMAEVLTNTGMNSEQKECVRSIQSSAINLLDLVNDILDYSQIETGKVEIHRERFILSDCFDQVTDIMKPLANQKRLELLTDIDPELPVEVVHDERRVRQIILNLVNNAVKFTEHGEVVLRAELVNRESDFVQIKFSVRDTGIGIDPSEIPFLFRSFSQIDPSVSRKYGGSGLGLAICKGLVTEMGGKIWVESTPGKGSTFFFTLVAEMSGVTERERVRGLNGMKALVVDDNKTNLKILVRQLSNWGIQATPFNSPDLVSEIIPDLRKFDFCILDMQMPEIDGATLAERIREKHNSTELPIIVLSSVGQHLVDHKGNLYNAYLTKPVRHSRLLNAISDVVVVKESDRNSSVQTGTFEGEFGHNKLKVLIAHDNELTRAVTEKTLHMMGCSYQVAHSGEEVIEQTRRDDFDLIIMDVDLPSLSGIETIRRLRKLTHRDEMPVVIGIGSDDAGVKARCLQAGMDEVVARPISSDDLQKCIHHLMDEPQD